MEEKKEVQEIQEEVVRISVRNLVEFILSLQIKSQG